MSRRPRFAMVALAVAAAVLAAGCGGSGETVSVYLPARLGPDGPVGQRSPVLTSVERKRRHGIAAARQAVLEVLVGPSPEERGRNYLDALPLGTRLLDVSVVKRAAIVTLAGEEPDLKAGAAIVYSLTELPAVEQVRLLLHGRACCVYSHAGEAVSPLTRRTFRFWSGEPCELRRLPAQVRCRAS